MRVAMSRILIGIARWVLGIFLAWDTPVTNLSRSTLPALLFVVAVGLIFGPVLLSFFGSNGSDTSTSGDKSTDDD